MNLYAILQAGLSIISLALLYPVMATLIILFIWVIIYTGGFIAEWTERRRKPKHLDLYWLAQSLREKVEGLNNPSWSSQILLPIRFGHMCES